MRQQIERAERSPGKRDEHLLFLIETLNTKIDGVAGDLADHRRDTEAYGAVYGVKGG